MLPLALSLSTLLFAGPPADADVPAKSPWRIGAGYYGDIITHPGGFAEFSWIAAEVRPFSFSLGADIGGYDHVRIHSAIFIRGNFATRVTFKPGILIEPRFVIGYAHTFVQGDAYFVIDEEGMLREKTPGGDPNLVYGFGLGLGYEIQRGPAAGLGFVVRPEIIGRYPYNDFVLTQFALLGGVQWRFGKRGAR